MYPVPRHAPFFGGTGQARPAPPTGAGDEEAPGRRLLDLTAARLVPALLVQGVAPAARFSREANAMAAFIGTATLQSMW